VPDLGLRRRRSPAETEDLPGWQWKEEWKEGRPSFGELETVVDGWTAGGVLAVPAQGMINGQLAHTSLFSLVQGLFYHWYN
jgi:hypothetical protein